MAGVYLAAAISGRKKRPYLVVVSDERSRYYHRSIAPQCRGQDYDHCLTCDVWRSGTWGGSKASPSPIEASDLKHRASADMFPFERAVYEGDLELRANSLICSANGLEAYFVGGSNVSVVGDHLLIHTALLIRYLVRLLLTGIALRYPASWHSEVALH